MGAPSDNLLTAGRFAEMAGITKAQLRFYRQAGVFLPAWRDPENGYFYYDIWQVHHLCMLLLLEHFGYSIKELNDLFQEDILSYREMILNRQVYLDDRISQLQQTVSFVEYDIRRNEHTDAYDDEQIYSMEMPPQEIVTTMLEHDCDRFDEMAHEGLLRHMELYGNTGDYRSFPVSVIMSRRSLYDGGYHLSGFFSLKKARPPLGQKKPVPVLYYRFRGKVADLNRMYARYAAYLQAQQLEPAGDIYMQVMPENTRRIEEDVYVVHAYLPIQKAALPVRAIPLPEPPMPYRGSILMSSGEFARLCGITKETLRFYHKHRLIVPVKKDEKGYYYYACQQLATFHTLKALQYAGCSLKEIRERFADEKLNFTQICKQYLGRLKRQLELAEYYLECLDVDYHYTAQLARQPRGVPFIRTTSLPMERITHIDPPCPLTAKDLAPYVKTHTTDFSNIDEKLQYPLSLHFRPEDLESGKQVACALSSLPHVNYAGELSTPPRRILCCMTRGSYSQMYESAQLLYGHMKAHGLKPVGNFQCAMLVDKFCRLPQSQLLLFVYVPIAGED
jgi:DNA-binding transcriptional MerR regulator/DNA gyrase inhibitor GyrI